MKALITGATGFVGSALLRLLVKQDYDLQILKRPGANTHNLFDFDIKVIEGDLQNIESLESAVDSCEQVFHVAADYRLWVPDSKDMFKTNIDGTRNLIKVAKKAGVKKIVYTSSVATLGTNQDGTSANETTFSTLENTLVFLKQ